MHEPAWSSMRRQRQLNPLPTTTGTTQADPFPALAVLNDHQLTVAQFFWRRMTLHDPDRQFGPIGETQKDQHPQRKTAPHRLTPTGRETA